MRKYFQSSNERYLYLEKRRNLLDTAINQLKDKDVSNRVGLIKDTIIKGINFDGCRIDRDMEEKSFDISLMVPDKYSIIVCHIKLYNLEDKVMIKLSNEATSCGLLPPCIYPVVYDSYRWRTLTIEQFNKGLTIN